MSERIESDAQDRARGIPPASLARLPIYLRVLTNLLADEVERVSSEELAEAAGVNSPQLRRDLSHLGTYGTRGVGYDVKVLMTEISHVLGLSQQWRVAIIGAGNLGRALAGYSGFGTRGFDVAAIFDADQLVVGTEIGYLRVAPMSQLEQVLSMTRVNMAVLAVPGAVAQEVADRIVAAGITSILSFAPVVLQVPEHVQVRKVDVATELQILAYHAQRAQDPDVPESHAL
ncbi:redox-sensing transcriptional repressor Rex [Haematomicrobium sanguinis]|uniref:redox-sensing transcriptional repressor Rex n=1 Tax=Haematomicrobium sanguinis TaxID=479106 RepID=UPI00068C4AAB|nr:redox-sensing transcriptional repressor Rex [Haematomicrobium sanguinis]